MCRRFAGEKGKKCARDDGKGKERKRLFPLLIIPRAFAIFRLLLFFGIPSWSLWAGERAFRTSVLSTLFFFIAQLASPDKWLLAMSFRVASAEGLLVVTVLLEVSLSHTLYKLLVKTYQNPSHLYNLKNLCNCKVFEQIKASLKSPPILVALQSSLRTE